MRQAPSETATLSGNKLEPAEQTFGLMVAEECVEAQFLAIDEVGGPPLGMSSRLLSLLTSVRIGFRFRSELIQRFPNEFI